MASDKKLIEQKAITILPYKTAKFYHARYLYNLKNWLSEYQTQALDLNAGPMFFLFIHSPPYSGS